MLLLLSDLTDLAGFLVTLRSISVLVFDCLISKLACYPKSMSLNVIMHVLFCAAAIALVPVH